MRLAKRNGLRKGHSSPSRASSRSFCTACGSTKLIQTGRRKSCRVTGNKEIKGSRSTAGKDVPAGRWRGENRPILPSSQSERLRCNIDPPASSYAHHAEAGPLPRENSGPGKDDRGELDTKPELENAIGTLRPFTSSANTRQVLGENGHVATSRNRRD